jgi:GTP-binding protein EngB required for normal cell division
MSREFIRRHAHELNASSSSRTVGENLARAEQEVRSTPAATVTAELLPYFTWPAGDVPPDVNAALSAVADCQHMLRRSEKRITFFGGFKAGKSTIINALVGRNILPTRANRATGVVTRLSHGNRVGAWLELQTDGKVHRKAIALHDVPHYTLLDLSQAESKNDESIREVLIHLPSPLLKHRVVLVDTPGLRDSPAMTARCRHEVAVADLAVMVLDGTQVLSEADRCEAAHVNELLAGNLVFLINRMDQIGSNEREEVMQYVREGVAEVGNTIVGRGRVFPSAALALPAARTNSSNGADPARGLAKFEQWLGQLVESGDIDRVAVLSRLSVLDDRLGCARRALESSLEEARRSADHLHRREVTLAQAEVREHQRKVAQDILALARLRGELEQFGSMFVDGVRKQADSLMSHSDWPQRIATAATQPLAAYVQAVNQRVKGAVTCTNLPLPAFSLNRNGAEGVEAAKDNAALIGGGIGLALSLMTFGMDFGFSTIAGPAVAAFLSKRLFGRDIKQETKDKLLSAARNAKAAIRAEAEKYLNVVEGLLNTVKQSPPQRRPAPNDLQEAKAHEQRLAQLLAWCCEFDTAVKRVRQRAVQSLLPPEERSLHELGI